MKTQFFSIGAATLLIAQSLLFYTPVHAIQDPELDQAVQWMYDNDLTKYSTTSAYNPEEYLTREQGAKFFVNFAGALDLNIEAITGLSGCSFVDDASMDPTLKDWVNTSCTLGLFKGAKGYFFPTEVMTKAQAITVLIRALEGPQDETTIPRWKNYYQQARALSLTKEQDVMALDKAVTRYEIALILYRASQSNAEPQDPIQDEKQIQELIELLKKLGLQSA